MCHGNILANHYVQCYHLFDGEMFSLYVKIVTLSF